MKGKRLLQTLRLCLTRSGRKRADYLKKVFHSVGDHCIVMDRKIPLYPEMISLGNNVYIGSHVFLTTHDYAHAVVNNYLKQKGSDARASEKIGCIEIGDNVFIGSGTRVLGDVRIGSNVIIGASSLVNKDIPDNSVAAGVPAKVICSFDEFVDRRLKQSDGTKRSPAGENISAEDAENMWKAFHDKRSLT